MVAMERLNGKVLSNLISSACNCHQALRHLYARVNLTPFDAMAPFLPRMIYATVLLYKSTEPCGRGLGPGPGVPAWPRPKAAARACMVLVLLAAWLPAAGVGGRLDAID